MENESIERILLGIDIDGVFNPCRIVEKDEPEITKTTVYYLNKILEAVPNCDVLITSSCGNKYGKTTKALCEQGFLYPGRIVGNTSFIETEYSRTKEIVKWMDMNPKYTKIICIDDEPILFDFFENKYGANRYNVVEVRSDIGLDEYKAYETVCKLLGFNFRFWG